MSSAYVVDRYSRELLDALLSATEASRTATEVYRRCYGATPDVVREVAESAGVNLPAGNLVELGYHEQPELHPLYHEWYFTPSAARHIAEVANSSGSSFTLLGVPSVANEMVSARFQVRLIDADPAVPKRFPALAAGADVEIGQVASSPVREKADVVVIDPPWYPEHFRHWLAMAARHVRPGGVILSTLFPALTRPTALEDRDRVFALAARMGSIELYRGVLTYSSPRFEVESLAAAGVNHPGDWRTADLLVIRRVTRSPNVAHVEAGEIDDWKRFEIGSQVVMMRRQVAGRPGPPVESIDGCPNDVLTSVSARDPRRAQVDLWSSRSRVLRVNQPEVVEGWLSMAQSQAGLASLLERAHNVAGLNRIVRFLAAD